MYYELKVFVSAMKEDVIYPDVARKLVAEACNGLPVDPAIFTRDAQGKTLNGWYGRNESATLFPEKVGIPPLISFDGAKGMIRLYGHGKQGSEILKNNSALIFSAISRHTKSACRIEVCEGDLGLQLSEPNIYVIRRLVMTKSPVAHQRFVGTSAPDRAEDVSRVIYEGLVSQAYFIDSQGGLSDGQDLLGKIPKQASLRIEVFEGKLVGQEIKNGINSTAYKNVIFGSNVDLIGPWQAGKLRSRGCGYIRRMVRHD